MAESLIHERNDRNLWAEYKKLEGQTKQKPPHMDDRIESKDIADLLTDKYSTLYNSVPSDKEELFSIKERIQDELVQYTDSEHIITVHEVRKTISRLHEDKSDGDGELWSNHIIYAPESLSIHISMLLTGVITHGYNPIDLLTGTLVSIPKDTCGNICDSDNCSLSVYCLRGV